MADQFAKQKPAGERAFVLKSPNSTIRCKISSAMRRNIGSETQNKSNPASTVERIFAALGIIGIGSAAFAVRHFNPVTAGFFPQCPLYQLTGVSCPGCGLTRGFHALFHGDVVGALGYNALLPVYAFILVYFLVSLFLIAARGQGLSFRVFPQRAMYGFLMLALVFGVVRNLPFYPFTILAP